MKKYKFLLSIVFIFNTIISSKAQNINQLDSLFDAGNYENCISQIKDNSAENSFVKIACLIKLGQITEAENLFSNLKNIIPKYQPKYNLLNAQILIAKGLNKDALTVLELSEKQLIVNKDLYLLSEVYNQIGLANWGLGNIEKAKIYLLKALNIRELKFGKNHIYTASIYNNLGLILTNDIDLQTQYYNIFIKAYLQKYGSKHPSVAIGYNNLALLALKNNQLDSAKVLINKSLSVRLALYGENHHAVAFCYQTLAHIALNEGEKLKADSLFRLTLVIYNKVLPSKHPEKASVYNSLAQIALDNRKYSDAKQLLNNALENNSQKTTSNNFSISTDYLNGEIMLTSLQILSQVYIDRYFYKSLLIKDLKTALQILQKADTIIGYLKIQKNESQDKINLTNISNLIYENAVHTCVTLARVTHKYNFYNNLAFEFSEKNKATVLLSAINEVNAKEFSGIPAQLLDEETRLKNLLNFFEASYSNTPQAFLHDSIFIYKRKIEKFTAKLEKEYPQYYQLKYSVKIATIEELTAKLVDNEALIDYVWLSKYNKLYVFTFQKNSKLKLYDLNLETGFDKYISALRNAITFNEEAKFLKWSTLIYKNVFPFKFNKSVNSLIIIPDGSLHLLPFESLNSNKSARNYKTANYLLQRFNTVYQLSSTLFLQMRTESQFIKCSKMLLCNPVEFGGNNTIAQDRGDLSTLNGTIEEVQNISQTAKSKQVEINTLSLKNASEYKFKCQKLADYQYIHLASHGSVDLQNPQFSKIYFSSDTAGNQDGELTAGEIYNLKLNAELFSLSACETGRGKIQQGEGVIGLTRALLYAGANNAMVSYWKVNDYASSKLMSDFYRYNLVENYSLTESLRKSKLDLLQSEKYYSPYYWAAFFLIGK
jgi:CHAT domain-containing protein